MRNAVLGLALVSAIAMGTSAHAGSLSAEQSMVQPVYWDGYGCGPRCQEHQWRRHERWEAQHREWHHRQWEERHYGYNTYPRY
jgi:hypothetical protein